MENNSLPTKTRRCFSTLSNLEREYMAGVLHFRSSLSLVKVKNNRRSQVLRITTVQVTDHFVAEKRLILFA